MSFSFDSKSGKLILLTAPSGSGKTTIARHLLQKYEELDFSVSATTREPRHYETDGKDYYFISSDEFKQRLENGEFVEHEEVYENQYYGTLQSEIERIWALGKSIVFDIDVKGAKNLKEQFGEQCLSIFIRPPSLEVLIERLTNRKTESEDSLKKRIKRVTNEMDYENYFDVVLVNDILDVALIESEHLLERFVYGGASKYHELQKAKQTRN